MTLEITSANFMPFTHRQQLLLTALTTQVGCVCQGHNDATDVLQICTARGDIG